MLPCTPQTIVRHERHWTGQFIGDLFIAPLLMTSQPLCAIYSSIVDDVMTIVHAIFSSSVNDIIINVYDVITIVHRGHFLFPPLWIGGMTGNYHISL